MIKITTTEVKINDLQEKIASLQEGDFLYIHPANPAELANFGKFSRLSADHPPDYNNINLEIGVTFSFEERLEKKLWIPIGYSTITRVSYSIPKILEGRIRLYVNEEIKKGMEENNNPCYGLVKTIIEGSK